MNNDILQTYIKQIVSQFPQYTDKEKKYVNFIERNIKLHLQEYPETTYEKLQEVFGNPEDIVNDYYLSIDKTELSEQLSSNARKRSLIIAGLIVLSACAIGFIIFLFYHYS